MLQPILNHTGGKCTICIFIMFSFSTIGVMQGVNTNLHLFLISEHSWFLEFGIKVTQNLISNICYFNVTFLSENYK